MFSISKLNYLVVEEMPTPKTPGEALELSIKKWEVVVANPGCYDGADGTCALCWMFFYDKRCGMCPVAQARSPGCVDTPYEAYNQSQDVEDAKSQLAFLKSLRPCTCPVDLPDGRGGCSCKDDKKEIPY